MIDADSLTAAAEGHFERTRRPLVDVLADLGVDGDEVRALVQVAREQRNPPSLELAPSSVYSAGWLDGFIIGVRAAREAARREALNG